MGSEYGQEKLYDLGKLLEEKGLRKKTLGDIVRNLLHREKKKPRF